jgi:hypothetical protein
MRKCAAASIFLRSPWVAKEELTMLKEIDILVRANSKGCLIVDKESHVLLEKEELLTAHRDGLYQEDNALLAPDKNIELSGPFPGCMQLGDGTNWFRMVGQTEHFAIFYPADGEVPLLGPEVITPKR